MGAGLCGEDMDSSRRRVILAGTAGVAAIFLGAAKGAPQDPGLPSPRRRNNSEPEDPNSPGPPAAARKAVLEQHQKDIKKDIEKLFDLAQELKAEVEKTDATAVLSLSMLKKTEEIEKLAKQIREHAKG
jgi:hypothetical protein